MITPKWYRAKSAVQVVQLSSTNMRDVREWITRNSTHQVISDNVKYMIVFTSNPYKEKSIRIGEWIVIDNVGEIHIFTTDQFCKVYYEVSNIFRPVEDVDAAI